MKFIVHLASAILLSLPVVARGGVAIAVENATGQIFTSNSPNKDDFRDSVASGDDVRKYARDQGCPNANVIFTSDRTGYIYVVRARSMNGDFVFGAAVGKTRDSGYAAAVKSLKDTSGALGGPITTEFSAFTLGSPVKSVDAAR